MDMMNLLSQHLPAPIFFLVILVVQLKIIRTLRSHTTMIMYYGKQIEDLRKMVSATSRTRAQDDISPDEPGLYEVLGE